MAVMVDAVERRDSNRARVAACRAIAATDDDNNVINKIDDDYEDDSDADVDDVCRRVAVSL